MTLEEKIDVMQAYLAGKKIQYRDYMAVPVQWVDVEEPAWNWASCDYRVVPEEEKPEYRPYKDADEMVEDFYKRINSGKASYSMPLIWVKSKANGDIELITGYSKADKCVLCSVNWDTFEQLFNGFEYLDGSPVGKKVE